MHDKAYLYVMIVIHICIEIIVCWLIVILDP